MKNIIGFLFKLILMTGYIFLFILMYLRYVPLMTNYQLFYLPILLILFVATLKNKFWGTYLFLFLIPSINFYPYFFELKPISPLLMLFYAYFFAILSKHLFGKKGVSFLDLKEYILYKIVLIIIMISGTITFLRYSNFFLFHFDTIYNWVINAINVNAGAAIFRSISDASNLVGGILFSIISINLKNDNGKEGKNFFEKAIFFISVGFAFSIIVALIQIFISPYFGNMKNWVEELRRINATFTDPNALGIFLVLILPVILSNIFEKLGLRRVIYLALFIGGIFILPFSGSRSGFLGLIFSFVIIFILLFKVIKHRINVIKLILISLIIIIMSVVILNLTINIFYKTILFERLYENLFNLKHNYYVIKTISDGRNYTWSGAFFMIKDYPITGIGNGAYIVELPNFYIKYFKGLGPIDTAGNMYLQILAEMGIIGFIAFIGFIGLVIKKIFKRLKEGFKDSLKSVNYTMIGVYSSFISFLIISMLGFHIIFPEICFTFFFLIAMIMTESGTSEIVTSDQGSVTGKLVTGKVVTSELEDKGEGSKKVEAAKWSKWKKILFLGIILVYGGVFLYHSMTSLSIPARTKEFGWKQDYGFDKWEEGPYGEYRWSKRGAGHTQTIEKPFVIIPAIASHPDLEKNPLDVKVFFSEDPFKKGKPLEEFKIKEKKWLMRAYYFPQYVGKDIFFSFRASRTWNPLKTLGVPDPRNLGIGVAKTQFKDEIGEEGIGFYGWEDMGRFPFRWTQDRGMIELTTNKEEIAIPVAAGNPDVRKNPVIVRIKVIGEGRIEVEERLKDNLWHEVRVHLGEKGLWKKVVIQFEVSRTWRPVDFGLGEDRRELGIKVGKIY